MSPRPPLAVGLAGLLALLVGGWFDQRAAWAAYLTAIVGWTALPLGAMAVLMVATLVPGRWRGEIARGLIAASATLPIAGLLFIPVLAGLGHVYPWISETPHAPVPGFKDAYLAPGPFALRTVLYFVIWSVLAWWLRSGIASGGGRAAASIGLIVYAITGSLAGIDWAMSLQPEFHSSIYGLLFLGRDFVAGLSLGILLARRGDPGKASLGGALISVILLWAYLHAMQFIVMWSGDLPDEVAWYLIRVDGLWQLFPYLLGAFGGFVPFLALLSERNRSDWQPLRLIAAMLVATGFIEAVWLILPPLQIARL